MLQVRVSPILARLRAQLRAQLRKPSASRLNIGTFAILGFALIYLWRFATDMPYVDEWDLTAVILNEMSLREWSFTRLNEHLFIPGNALWWLTMNASGLDFRAGMLVNLSLHLLASLLLMNAARRIRGSSSLADMFIPVCLLHYGHAYNLLMSYQIVFGLFLLSAAVVLWVIATVEPGRERRTATRGAFALLLLMLSGGMGIAFVPVLSLWIAVLAWRSRSMLPFVLLTIAAAYTAFALFGAPTATPKEAIPLGRLAWCVVQYLGIGSGLWFDGPHWPRNGILIAILYAMTTLLLVAKTIRTTDGGRSAGLLAMLFGHFAVALGIAYSRGGCLAERYVTISALGLIIAYLAIVSTNPKPRWFVTAMASVSVILFTFNLISGNAFGKTHRRLYAEFEVQARAGLSSPQLCKQFSKRMRVGENVIPAIERLKAHGKPPFDE